jgi:hypothetical protein
VTELPEADLQAAVVIESKINKLIEIDTRCLQEYGRHEIVGNCPRREAMAIKQERTDVIVRNSPQDQAALDLNFIAAFFDLLGAASSGDIELQDGTISDMCYESGFKIEALKKFIAAVPMTKMA